MTAPEWRDCADPDELAAAVAAGVVPEWTADDWPGWRLAGGRNASQFSCSMEDGRSYRVPTSWTWSPEPPAPDELRDTDPGLIRQLHDMADRWGARGVMETGATLWPDALPTTSGGDPRDAVRLLDLAWGVIANADGWGDDTSWRQAAERWRDGYHRFLDALREEPTAPPAPTPPPATGAERYLAGRMADPEYRAAYEATSPPAPDDLRERLRLGIEDAVNDYADVVMDIMDAEVVRHAGWLAARLEEADAERTTLRHRLAETPPATADPWSKEALSLLPVPPWPGAVLSGLVDEDGVPTWLALAPNVLGEAVRTCIDFPWFVCGSDNAVTPYWVEVRAPRAVPEPETERVPVLDAIRDRIELTHPEGEFLAVGVELREDGDLVAIEQQEPWGKAQPVAPDGTVEVLRDGGR